MHIFVQRKVWFLTGAKIAVPGRIFTKCNRIRKTSCFHSSNSN